MLEAFGWGALGASSLLIGAAIGLAFDVPTRVVGWSWPSGRARWSALWRSS